jgi:hypothetical protein
MPSTTAVEAVIAVLTAVDQPHCLSPKEEADLIATLERDRTFMIPDYQLVHIQLYMPELYQLYQEELALKNKIAVFAAKGPSQ